MSKIERDTVMMGETPLVPGEVVKQVFLADKGIYWDRCGAGVAYDR